MYHNGNHNNNVEHDTKEFTNTLFGPLGKEACIYFYVLQVVSFILLVLACIHVLHGLFTVKNFNAFSGIVAILNAFVVYFVNRLLYSMCVH